jgi:hypothetical protein
MQWADLAQHVSLNAPLGWHLSLTPKVLPTQTIVVPKDKGTTVFDPTTQRVRGIVTWSYIHQMSHQLIHSLKIPPTDLPIFLTENTDASLDCLGMQCNLLGGYHGMDTTGSPVQQPVNQAWTYIWTSQFDYGSSVLSAFDTSGWSLSHEIAEWSADPFLGNVVPSWQLPPYWGFSCSNILEVADPVQQYLIGVPLPGGQTAIMADTVTLSYFARQVPSTGMFGLYDLTGQITAPSSSC